MKKIIIMLVVAGVVAATSMFAMANNGPAEVKLEASMGTVTFPHAAHQATVADCKTCHHNGVDAGKCASCHGVDAAAPKAKKAFHKLCKDCHKKQNGPTKCKGCHVK